MTNESSDIYSRRRSRRGFTLVEVIVVLVLLVLATALVAPAFVFREDAGRSPLASVVSGVQKLAARRGETLHLNVAADGSWSVGGAASPEAGFLAEGDLGRDYRGPRFTLVVSPLGSCGFDVRSTAAAREIPLEPLTCEVDAS